MSGSVNGIDRTTARRMVRSLTRGTTIADGARFIHVGHEKWIAAQVELLAEIEEDGGSETKFVRGAYGSGKSHFLVVIQDMARDRGWMTAHVECRVDAVQIDRFETLYPKIASKLDGSDLYSSEEAGRDGSDADPMRALLDKWSRGLLHSVGVRDDGVTKPFDAPERIYGRLETSLFRSNLPSDFVRALAVYVRAQEAGDFESTTSVVGWIKGGDQKVRLSGHYLRRPRSNGLTGSRDVVELRPLGVGTAAEALKGLLWLVRAAGYPGLILCVDEIEELAKLPNRRRRDQALQALREHVDNAGGEAGYRGLCLYLAATPTMFDDEQYFPRYDALQTRIAPVSDEINWRAPVIDLDRTPLGTDQMVEVARRIRTIHKVAYEGVGSDAFSDEAIEQLVTDVVSTRFSVAKPRLLARVVIDELERSRQSAEAGEGYRLPGNFEENVRRAAEISSREAEG